MSDQREEKKTKKKHAEEEQVTEELTGETEETAADDLRELNDRYLRVCADFDNFRRRTRQDREAGFDDGVIETVRALLPVLDSMDAAVKAAEGGCSEETREFLDGLVLIAQQMDETLRKIGVVEIEGVGADFDPHVHQAVLHGEDESLPENYVSQVFQKGYVKGSRVIRHSMVKVVN
ncbi:MAG TPA: nucleotide exchange factor GrpE [Clostridiaceae bacterium]|nr:nucleotide exchange factor GrpE [Clostridiaceae bacterium]